VAGIVPNLSLQNIEYNCASPTLLPTGGKEKERKRKRERKFSSIERRMRVTHLVGL
jgi:hypothetical protein